ncbi:MAG: hypothetical protein LW875_00300 [Proteobacteria bacterium]|nr:hypothetical protein [Pseudomonadota bacterium]
MDSRLWRLVMIGNLVVAGLLFLFWIGFYTEVIFPFETLSSRILHFEGYYAWETSFTVPDLFLAAALSWSASKLLRNSTDPFATLVLSSSAGALIFLGVLDFTYGIRHGMYELGHFFSWILLSIGLGLPIWGLLNIWILHKSAILKSRNFSG